MWGVCDDQAPVPAMRLRSKRWVAGGFLKNEGAGDAAGDAGLRGANPAYGAAGLRRLEPRSDSDLVHG